MDNDLQMKQNSMTGSSEPILHGAYVWLRHELLTHI